jgi:cytochrome P450
VDVEYNPRYFDEPEKFKPSRWYDLEKDSELFTAFSIGSSIDYHKFLPPSAHLCYRNSGGRACIGRKFAVTEAVCFLTLLLRDWKVEPMLRKGETKAQWKKRVIEAEVIITLGILDVPLRFRKRSKR